MISPSPVTILSEQPYTGTLPRTKVTRCCVANASGTVGVDLQVSEPDGPAVGMAWLGSGGSGTEFYGRAGKGHDLVMAALAAGYRVVQRAWLQPWALTGNAGTTIVERASRSMDLVRFLLKQFPGCPLRLTGNSGGSAEIAYMLCHHGLDAETDLVVLTGGPPMTRLDYLCEDPPSAEWAQLYQATLSLLGPLSCGKPAINSAAAGNGAGICTALAGSSLLASSVLAPNAKTALPTVRLAILVGSEDCSVAGPQAALFAHSITPQPFLAVVAGAPHFVCETTGGMQAIAAALLAP